MSKEELECKMTALHTVNYVLKCNDISKELEELEVALSKVNYVHDRNDLSNEEIDYKLANNPLIEMPDFDEDKQIENDKSKKVLKRSNPTDFMITTDDEDGKVESTPHHYSYRDMFGEVIPIVNLHHGNPVEEESHEEFLNGITPFSWSETENLNQVTIGSEKTHSHARWNTSPPYEGNLAGAPSPTE